MLQGHNFTFHLASYSASAISMLDPVLNQALVLDAVFFICTAQEENAVQILIKHSLEAMESSHVLVMRFHLKDETSLS